MLMATSEIKPFALNEKLKLKHFFIFQLGQNTFETYEGSGFLIISYGI